MRNLHCLQSTVVIMSPKFRLLRITWAKRLSRIYRKSSGDMQTVKVYLIPPEDSDFTNLVMTNDNAKQETSDGEYNGL